MLTTCAPVNALNQATGSTWCSPRSARALDKHRQATEMSPLEREQEA